MTTEEEVSFVEGNIDDHHECMVCLQLLKQPWIIECCGHHLCKPCIDQLVRGGNECPHCRTRRFRYVRDRHLERILMEKQVYCRYRSRGCEWQGTLRESDQHSSVIITCEWCHSSLKCYEENQHKVECAMANEVVNCEFKPFGCSKEILRKEVSRHMQENYQEHIKLLKQVIEKSTIEIGDLWLVIDQLKQEKECVYEEKETEIMELRARNLELSTQNLEIENELVELRARTESYDYKLQEMELDNIQLRQDKRQVKEMEMEVLELTLQKDTYKHELQTLAQENAELKEEIKADQYKGVLAGILLSFFGVVVHYLFPKLLPGPDILKLILTMLCMLFLVYVSGENQLLMLLSGIIFVSIFVLYHFIF